jgi:flavin reductase (DIM6/NTAB) family NADH-FMN oxidoreductase RutF
MPVPTSYAYRWPDFSPATSPKWTKRGAGLERLMPESADELAADSRWPAFFPSAICHVTSGAGSAAVLERVVGASIVNRFPYVMALSVCRLPLSGRHYSRAEFMRTLEGSAEAAVQFLEPGPAFDAAARAIADLPDSAAHLRIGASGLRVRRGLTVAAPVFQDAHLVYEARLAKPMRDLDGSEIYARPWLDVGSHRVYFLEITAIQLRADIAAGESQIRWRSLPEWRRPEPGSAPAAVPAAAQGATRYQKGYTPDYRFPSAGTRAFESDGESDGMKHLLMPPSLGAQIEWDNDRARWPCFFPSSVGMITCRREDGRPNLMPCGSTTMLARDPLTIGVAMAYAPINDRYRRRSSLEAIRRAGQFGCGVPYVDDRIISAITYAGNHSIEDDPEKIVHAGLQNPGDEPIPRLAELPVHFDCTVVGEERLGTHILLLGRVTRIFVHAGVGPGNPLIWNPLASVAPREN